MTCHHSFRDVQKEMVVKHNDYPMIFSTLQDIPLGALAAAGGFPPALQLLLLSSSPAEVHLLIIGSWTMECK